MKEVVIASAVRTPIGRFQGTLKDIPAVQLGTHAAKEAVNRAGIQPDAVQEVIMGMVLPAGLGQNPARQVSIHAGIPYEAGALTEPTSSQNNVWPRGRTPESGNANLAALAEKMRPDVRSRHEAQAGDQPGKRSAEQASRPACPGSCGA